jgi:murein L,D-transpeptidase YcbB/YkuD
MQSFVEGSNEMNRAGVEHPLLVREFYKQQNFKLVWLGSETLQYNILQLLSKAPEFGLEERDYQYSFIHRLRLHFESLSNLSDSIAADVRITDAAIHFLQDVKNGNQKLSFSYDGLHYTPSNDVLVVLLKEGVQSGNLDAVAVQLEPKSIEYKQMKQMLKQWNNITTDSSFQEVKVTSNKVSIENKNLLTKLQQLGVIQIKEKIDNAQLQQKVKAVQRLLAVFSDGMLRSTTLAALNVPLQVRVKELKRALNYLRWLNEIRQAGSIALVNIPAAQMLIYNTDQLIFDSRIIAGKPSTPTATLSSTIKEVIVYPYWNVPHSIATRELLPRIKRNIGYLGANNYLVLNTQGKVMNPYTINWQSLSASYFPYTIRQATGCDNALGILKFNFYNPFSMYLHDTPGKSLFLLNKRFFSHGCMRVEKPVELAKLLLKDKVASVERLINQCLKDQLPVTIPINEPLPLMVFYSTAWYNEKGEVRFYEDVYKRNYAYNPLKKE